MDTLTSIKVFRQVVESGSFVSASERLDLSTAMVSKHVMHIEKRIGVRLLNRNSRKLSLTEPGRVYFERCKNVLDGLEQTELEITVARLLTYCGAGAFLGLVIGLLSDGGPLSILLVVLFGAGPFLVDVDGGKAVITLVGAVWLSLSIFDFLLLRRTFAEISASPSSGATEAAAHYG